MSRTKRSHKYHFGSNKDYDMKHRASKTDHVSGYSKGVSAYDKLITTNANRSLKKRIRQRHKKEIINQLTKENG